MVFSAIFVLNCVEWAIEDNFVLDVVCVACSSHPGADFVQTGGDGFGRGVTAEHMTF